MSIHHLLARARRNHSGGLSGWYAPLFAAGEKGLIFDFNDLSTLYQDTSATLPVTAAGDVVQAVKCKRTGIVITNTTGVPLAFDSAKNLFYLNFSGSSFFDQDGGVDPSLLGSSAKSVICGWSPNSTTPAYPFCLGGQSASRDSFGMANDAVFTIFTTGSGGGISDSVTQTGIANYIGIQDASNPNVLTGYKDTTQRLSAPIGVPAANITTNRVTVGGYGRGYSGGTYGRITSPLYFVILIGRVITPSEIAAIVAASGL